MTQVLQVDREAAWPYRPSCYKDVGNTRTLWMAGTYDASARIIQAFAAHREEAVAGLVRVLERIADGPWPDTVDGPVAQARWDEMIARNALATYGKE